MTTSTLPPEPTPALLRQVAARAEVAEGVDRVREALTGLRWHEGLRRRTEAAAAESRVRGAVASAAIEGAELAGSGGTLPLTRDLMRGATPWPDDLGPVELTARAASRVTAATEGIGSTQLRAPAQVLVRLHVAAAGDRVSADEVGRPRRMGETCAELSDLGPAVPADQVVARLRGINNLVAASADSQRVPTVLAVAVVHAELAVLRPFGVGNALVARALERVLLRARGVDPTGVAVPEAGHRSVPGPSYLGALSGYASGGEQGLVLWLTHWAGAMEAAAKAGIAVADAVRSGRSGD